MSPAPAWPGLVSRNQAWRPDVLSARLEASTEIACPVGAVPRLTHSAGRAAAVGEGAPGTSPGDAAGAAGLGEAGPGAGVAIAATLTLHPSSACLVPTPTFGSLASPAT